MIRNHPVHTDGYLHEVEILPRREPEYPFAEAQTADVYPRHYRRAYHVERGRYTPKIGLRTSWTNLLTYSSTLANAAHTKTNLTATDNVAAHPRDGLSTLGTLMETVTNAAHTIGRAHTFSAAVEHTLSVIAQANGRDWIRLLLNDGTEDFTGWFNLATGACTADLGSPTVSMVELPWPAVGQYRCSLTTIPRAAVGALAIALSSDGSTLSYAGNTSLGIYAGSLELKAAGAAGPVVETLGSTRTALCPDLDPDDCFAYLVVESAPAAVGIGDLQRVERTFARIPGQQLTRDYQEFARPNCSGLKSGTTYAARLGEGDDFHIWTARKEVLGAENTQGTTSNNALPSGNVTVLLSDASSASFAANADKATIDAALAALVSGTKLSYCYCAKSTDGSTVTVFWGYWVGQATVTSVTPPTGANVNKVGNQAMITAIGTTITPDSKLIHCPSHSAAVGLACAAWNGDLFAAAASVAGIANTDKLTIVLSDLSSPDFNITHLTFSSAAAFRYAAGSREINVRIAEDFWLAGVTMLADGNTLASLDSLPAVATYRAPQTWFDRIVAADTYTAINASQLATYLGPIQSRKTVSAKKDATCLESLALT